MSDLFIIYKVFCFHTKLYSLEKKYWGWKRLSNFKGSFSPKHGGSDGSAFASRSKGCEFKSRWILWDRVSKSRRNDSRHVVINSYEWSHSWKHRRFELATRLNGQRLLWSNGRTEVTPKNINERNNGRRKTICEL